MSSYGPLKILACRAAENFGGQIGIELDEQLLQKDFGEYDNDNTRVCLEDDVRGSDVFVIQQMAPPVNHNLAELLFAVGLLKQESAARITAVVPYYPYARSDWCDEGERTLITAAFVADMLHQAGAHRILTMDPHSRSIRGFVIQSKMNFDALSATKMLREQVKDTSGNSLVLVAPDAGSAKYISKHAEAMSTPYAIIDKRRTGHEGKTEAVNIVGDVEGSDVLMLDDETLTGGTFISASQLLKERGAERIFAACTHAFLNEAAVKKIEDSKLDSLFITNTIPLVEQITSEKITVITVAEMFAKAIRRIHEDKSIKQMGSKH